MKDKLITSSSAALNTKEDSRLLTPCKPVGEVHRKHTCNPGPKARRSVHILCIALRVWDSGGSVRRCGDDNGLPGGAGGSVGGQAGAVVRRCGVGRLRRRLGLRRPAERSGAGQGCRA